MSDKPLKLWNVSYFERGDGDAWWLSTATVEAASEDEAIKLVQGISGQRIYAAKPQVVDDKYKQV